VASHNWVDIEGNNFNVEREISSAIWVLMEENMEYYSRIYGLSKANKKIRELLDIA